MADAEVKDMTMYLDMAAGKWNYPVLSSSHL